MRTLNLNDKLLLQQNIEEVRKEAKAKRITKTERNRLKLEIRFCHFFLCQIGIFSNGKRHLRCPGYTAWTRDSPSKYQPSTPPEGYTGL